MEGVAYSWRWFSQIQPGQHTASQREARYHQAIVKWAISIMQRYPMPAGWNLHCLITEIRAPDVFWPSVNPGVPEMIVSLGDDHKTGFPSDNFYCFAIGFGSPDENRCFGPVGDGHKRLRVQRQIHRFCRREPGISESAKRGVWVGKNSSLSGGDHRQRARPVGPLVVFAGRSDLSYSQEIEQRRQVAVWVPGSLEKLFFNADRFAQIQGV